MKRGRKSAAELSVIGPRGIEIVRRPEPPVELTDEQAEVWRTIVNRMPADWFPVETLPMLAQYCRHVVRARRLGCALDNAERARDDFDLATWLRLLRAEEMESRAISSLATRMRLSQQSTYDKTRRKPTLPEGPRPWER